jgi:hypothetical protein
VNGSFGDSKAENTPAGGSSDTFIWILLLKEEE